MPRIDKIYAYVAADPGPDDEGITATYLGNTWMPMIGADKARMDSLREIAQQMADAQGKSIKLLEFSVRRELETIEPAIPGVQDPDPSMITTHFRPCQECGQQMLVLMESDEGPKTCTEHN